MGRRKPVVDSGGKERERGPFWLLSSASWVLFGRELSCGLFHHTKEKLQLIKDLGRVAFGAANSEQKHWGWKHASPILIIDPIAGLVQFFE